MKSELNCNIVLLLTGYGTFSIHTHKLNLESELDEGCECRRRDTMDRVISECRNITEHRNDMKTKLRTLYKR